MGYSSISIYLSGSVRHQNAKNVLDFFNEAEEYIKKRFAEEGEILDYNIYSPLRGKQCNSLGGWENHYTLKELIHRDENDIRKSDLIIVLSGDTPTDGTWWEAGFAHYVCKIPVLMVAPLRKKGEVYSWSNEKCTFIGESLKEVVDWIIEYWMAK